MAYIVKTTEGVFVADRVDGKEFVDQQQAETSANERNKNAEKLGIKTRYEAVEK